MQKIAPRISLVGWSLWLAIGLYTNFSSWSLKSVPNLSFSVILLLSEVGLKGGGIVLSAKLSQSPNRSLVFVMAALCLFASWKFYLADIIYHMMPALGGFTFVGAVADWWHRNTSEPIRFIRVMTFALFLGVSLIYWPLYGLVYGNQEGKLKM